MKTTNRNWMRNSLLWTLVALVAGMLSLAGMAQETANSTDVAEFDPIRIATGVLGLPSENLESYLDDGGTLAELARENGMDPEAIVAALQHADDAEIARAVEAGELMESEVAEWRDWGYVYAVEFVYLPIDEMVWEDEDFEDWMAEGFEYDDEEYEDSYPDVLYLPIEIQRSMATSLLDAGVEPEIVVDAVLESEANLFEQVFDFLFGWLDFESWGWFDEDEAYWEEVTIEAAASVLGLDEDAIWETLDDGGTLASLATAQGIDPQVLVDALIASEESEIAELLKDGELTEDEAAEWRAESKDYMVETVHEPWF